MTKTKLTAEKIYGFLAEQYLLPKWVLIPELRGATAYYSMRSIDAFAFACWSKPHPGYSIAYEIKVSRQDYMREMADPSKREVFVRNSHQFYFIVPHNLIKPEEVPGECGLIYVGETGRFTYPKIAPQRKMEEGYDPTFIASLLRNITDKDKAYHIGTRKLFKYAGKEVSVQDLHEIIEKEQKYHIETMESKALTEALKTVRAQVEVEYNQAIKDICKALGIEAPIPSMWHHEDKLYNIQKIINSIDTLKETLSDGKAQKKLDQIQSIISRED